MNKKLIDAFHNPIQGKLLLTIHAEGKSTAKQILEANKGVPQATVYRHLSKLAQDGIIEVVQENRIRGVVEKVYALSVSLLQNDALDHLSGETYMNLFLEYMMGLMQEFELYTSQGKIDIANDGTGFSLMPIYATKEELAQAGQKISEILMPLAQNQPTPERRYQNVGLIFTPPKTIE